MARAIDRLIVVSGDPLAQELASEKIRINAVCPGAIESDISDNTQQRNSEEAEVPVEFPEGDIPLVLYPAIQAWLKRIQALPGFVPMAASRKL